MPESWQDDHYRRKKAKIAEYICHETKPQMALGMVEDFKKRGVRFDYLAFDALYGSSFDFIDSLNRAGMRFIGDVKENVSIYLQEPRFVVPKNRQALLEDST